MGISIPNKPREKDVLDKLEQGFGIAQRALGIGLAIPEFLEKKTARKADDVRANEMLELQKQGAERADMGLQANIGKAFVEDDAGDIVIGDKKYRLRDTSEKAQKKPGAADIFNKANIKVFLKPTPGALPIETAEGHTIYISQAPEEGKTLSPDQYIKNFFEAKPGQQGAMQIAVKDYSGNVDEKWSLPKDKAQTAVDPNDVLSNVVLYEKKVQEYFDSGFGNIASKPYIGKLVGAGFREAGQLPAVVQEMVAVGTGTLQKLVRMFQGGRPSDFDYLIAQRAFEVKFGEDREMSMAKLSALKEMMNSYVQSRKQGATTDMLTEMKKAATSSNVMSGSQFQDTVDALKREHPNEYKEWENKKKTIDNLSLQTAEDF